MDNKMTIETLVVKNLRDGSIEVHEVTENSRKVIALMSMIHKAYPKWLSDLGAPAKPTWQAAFHSKIADDGTVILHSSAERV
jgi:hypothetical protein